MTTREKLHELIDHLAEDKLPAVLTFLEDLTGKGTDYCKGHPCRGMNCDQLLIVTPEHLKPPNELTCPKCGTVHGVFEAEPPNCHTLTPRGIRRDQDLQQPQATRELSQLGWSKEETQQIRSQLLCFEQDWNAPGMDAYDAL